MQARYFCFVKTYPNISKKYVEVTCTAGILELPEGRKLVRVYPVPYRFLDSKQKFPKYSWLEVKIQQDVNDGRPESYKLIQPYKIKVLQTLPVSNVSRKVAKENWAKRKRIIMDFVEPMENIISNWKEKTLGIIKPKKILEFYIQKEEVKLGKNQEIILRQRLLYEDKDPLEIIPLSFRYRFIDDSGKEHDYKLLDWEVYQAYRGWRGKYPDEDTRLKKIKEKFFDKMLERDLYFVIGNHNRWRDKFFIIGLLYFPSS